MQQHCYFLLTEVLCIIILCFKSLCVEDKAVLGILTIQPKETVVEGKAGAWKWLYEPSRCYKVLLSKANSLGLLTVSKW